MRSILSRCQLELVMPPPSSNTYDDATPTSNIPLILPPSYYDAYTMGISFRNYSLIVEENTTQITLSPPPSLHSYLRFLMEGGAKFYFDVDRMVNPLLKKDGVPGKREVVRDVRDCFSAGW